jgi:SAM-dependent methyltransferase
MPASPDDKRHAPATAHNREPIAEILARALPARGLVLEVASGTGEHAVWFAERFPDLTWQPSDPDPAALRSIAAWVDHAGTGNVRPPVALDAVSPDWPVDAADAVVCINMIHISPWAATEGLLAGAARILPGGGPLFLYGPYRKGGDHTAPSNATFDESLRARDAAWGIRDMETVVGAAAEAGFDFVEAVAMPANNFSIILRRAAQRPAGGGA